MRWNRLSTKLLCGAIAVVVVSAFGVAALATYRYSQTLTESLRHHSILLGQSLAAEATELILTHDVVALQKMAQHQTILHPDLVYLFVEKDGAVTAHSFNDGFPQNLLRVHAAAPPSQIAVAEVVSEKGERFLDIAVPILEGQAGRLRLGFSEQALRGRIRTLWANIALITLLILLTTIVAISLLVRTLIRPLARLTQAVDCASLGELSVRVEEQGDEEVVTLARSFNRMMDRLEEHTRNLQKQAQDLFVAQQQARAFCDIVQNVGALPSLQDIGTFLIRRFRDVLQFETAALLLFDDAREILLVMDEETLKTSEDPSLLRWFSRFLETLDRPGTRTLTTPPGTDGFFKKLCPTGTPCGVVPIHAEDPFPFGILMVRCDGPCHCPPASLDLIAAMLREASRVLRRAVVHEMEMRFVKRLASPDAAFCGIVGRDPGMQNVFRLIENVAASDATVLIQGESGTGKELVAHAIHQMSPRSAHPFVVINCAAYPPTLIETELFGHEKGAFTGADRARQGRFEQARGGTVFLDEVGEIPAPVQVKLLRVLQTHEFERVGGEKTLAADVRVVAATHRTLLDEVKNGRFREDLFYRLNVIPLLIPPLRRRPADIPLLARHFLQKFRTIHKKDVKEFHRDVLRLFMNYDWPGNVRELENTVEHAVLLSKNDVIQVWDLPSALARRVSVSTENLATMEERERKAIMEALEASRGNKKKAAQKLGISRSALYNKLKKYGLDS